MNTEHLNWVTRLLHFSDSALPVGAYAHSFGLEGVCQMGVVKDVETLTLFLQRDVAHALNNIDLPLTAKAYQAAMDANVGELQSLDQLSWAMRPTKQLRDAGSKIGKQQWKLYEKAWNDSSFSAMELSHHQATTVMGMVFAAEGVPLEAGLWSVVYQTYSALLQASLKLIPIGPSATQAILTESLQLMEPHLSKAAEMNEHEMGSFNPIWDIGAAKHERAPARLFLS